jgi:hypothetical protein
VRRSISPPNLPISLSSPLPALPLPHPHPHLSAPPVLVLNALSS